MLTWFEAEAMELYYATVKRLPGLYREPVAWCDLPGRETQHWLDEAFRRGAQAMAGGEGI
jgi:hypothetical protein